MNENVKVWNYHTDEIVNGYAEEECGYRCIFCNAFLSKGRVYRERDLRKEAGASRQDDCDPGQNLYDAYGAICCHVKNEHGNTADWLLQWDADMIGISEIQRNILHLMSDGKNDKEIALSSGIAESTVRNHRFKLREKEKQAKLFLALMESLEKKTERDIASSDRGLIEETHMSAAMRDDRYSITMEERVKTIKTYMDENGAIKQFPAREKKKIILLGEIIKNFKTDVQYTEKEVNRVLKRVYAEDYVGIRRALIEYGFLDRTTDCSFYMVKDPCMQS